MSEFTKEDELALLHIMMSITDEQKLQDAQWGLFLVWDYLLEKGFSMHHVCQYMEQQGDLLVNKAVLAEIIEL